MCKEDKYSNRMSLPRDGALLAENNNILLKAVSEDQKDSVYHTNALLLNMNSKMKLTENIYGKSL